jgi:hypothetical protein
VHEWRRSTAPLLSAPAEISAAHDDASPSRRGCSIFSSSLPGKARGPRAAADLGAARDEQLVSGSFRSVAAPSAGAPEPPRRVGGERWWSAVVSRPASIVTRVTIILAVPLRKGL